MTYFNLIRAARYLGISAPTLRRYCNIGIAPAHTTVILPTGYSKTRFTQEALDEWKKTTSILKTLFADQPIAKWKKGTVDGHTDSN